MNSVAGSFTLSDALSLPCPATRVNFRVLSVGNAPYSQHLANAQRRLRRSLCGRWICFDPY